MKTITPSIPNNWIPYITDNKYLLLLMNPEFVEKAGIIIIKTRHRRNTIPNNWIKFIHNNPQDMSRMENTINHVHMSAISENITLQKSIGKRLVSIWKNKLKSQFPNHKFVTRLVFNIDDKEWELQSWTERGQINLRDKTK